MRRVAILVGVCWLALAGVASAGVVIVIIGPRTPDAHSTRGMQLKFTPSVGDAGTDFKGVASGFKPGEYVTVWNYEGEHSSQLNGGFATKSGRLTIYRQTAAGISGGKGKVCAQGVRTKRVACGNYTVRTTGGGTDNGAGGYTPPQSDGDFTPPTSG
jgi:hypothetical protein